MHLSLDVSRNISATRRDARANERSAQFDNGQHPVCAPCFHCRFALDCVESVLLADILVQEPKTALKTALGSVMEWN